jgi:hypothetical protein
MFCGRAFKLRTDLLIDLGGSYSMSRKNVHRALQYGELIWQTCHRPITCVTDPVPHERSAHAIACEIEHFVSVSSGMRVAIVTRERRALIAAGLPLISFF